MTLTLEFGMTHNNHRHTDSTKRLEIWSKDDSITGSAFLSTYHRPHPSSPPSSPCLIQLTRGKSHIKIPPTTKRCMQVAKVIFQASAPVTFGDGDVFLYPTALNIFSFHCQTLHYTSFGLLIPLRHSLFDYVSFIILLSRRLPGRRFIRYTISVLTTILFILLLISLVFHASKYQFPCN